MLYRSDTSKLTKPVITTSLAGVPSVNIFEYTFDAAFVAASDVIEIGLLPAHQRIVALSVIGLNTAANQTATVGIMSGRFSDNDPTRTLETAITAALDCDDETTAAPLSTLIAFEPTSSDRGLGIELSVNEAASASKKITVVLETIAD